MAIGMSINADQIDGLNNHLALEFETKFLKNGWKPSLSVDIEADLNLANMDNYQYLSMLAPFGKSNPPPIFFSRDLIISELRLVGGSHLRFKFTQGESGFSTEVLGIAFGFGEFLSKLKVGQKVDVAWILNKNQYKGFVSAQMMIQDIRV